ncbi:MAG: DNA repair protein RadA [Desulfonauticus sp.]|nr:DNA repair protein RadA [Desulfonauticus sp.]
MAKQKRVYICKQCNSRFFTWYGQCPKCGAWNSLQESFGPSKREKDVNLSSINLVCSEDSHIEQNQVYFSTGSKEIDVFLGGGLVKGGVYLLGGEPGIGKSTWLLQLAGSLASKQNLKVIYVSGEESVSQVHTRARRLGVHSKNLFFLYARELDCVLQVMQSEAKVVIVDSIQTISSPRLDALAGSPSQIREVSLTLIERAKQLDSSLFLVGHVTKDGVIAGPKLLEHMVDCVLYFEGDKEHLFRLIRVVKNRYGAANEILVLEMSSKGLEVVIDPATFFLQDVEGDFSGQALALTLDGQKVFAVEVQALVNRSFLAIPRRMAQGIDQNRFSLLLAVLEKKLRINLQDKDVYIKIGRGLHIREPGIDLALCAAILSSFYDKPLPKRSVFWGEVDLNGQVRSVLGHDLRMRQAKRLGYDVIFSPGETIKSLQEMQQKLWFK